MWFEKLTGFTEINPSQVRSNLKLEGNEIISKVNGKSICFGSLGIYTLSELKNRASNKENYKSNLKLSEVVSDIQELHKLKENNGAFFQVASQFNLLEMSNPSIIPEEGVAIYETDFTQGPACAIACGAGTIYRNYFVKLNGSIGQTSDQQIDCLSEMAKAFNNSDLWKMKNGYLTLSSNNLFEITKEINSKTKYEYETLKDQLQIGVQWETEVTLENTNNFVTQAFCSALPISYSDIEISSWETFAKLILSATYEATLYSALLNYERTNNNRVYLTLVGGGCFGNKLEWILDAIKSVILKFKHTPLDVKIVSYKNSNQRIRGFIDQLDLQSH